MVKCAKVKIPEIYTKENDQKNHIYFQRKTNIDIIFTKRNKEEQEEDWPHKVVAVHLQSLHPPFVYFFMKSGISLRLFRLKKSTITP